MNEVYYDLSSLLKLLCCLWVCYGFYYYWRVFYAEWVEYNDEGEPQTIPELIREMYEERTLQLFSREFHYGFMHIAIFIGCLIGWPLLLVDELLETWEDLTD